jgi:hypothetical protein
VNVYIANDTSGFHAGSWAVIASLKHKLVSAGHRIIATTPRPLAPDPKAIEACDAMVLNGEGALQEEALGWDDDRAANLLKGLALAKKSGKKAYLVNAVWHRMRPGWTGLLRSLDGLWVREVVSQQEMEKEQGVKPDVFLDLSYSCPMDTSSGSPDLDGKDVVGFFYRNNMPRFGAFDHSHRLFRKMKPLSLGGEAEGSKTVGDWSQVVHGLKGANLYVTGQHHGVYAACRARIPFVIFKLYNHKISGLFEWAGVDIPIARNRWELAYAIRWARRHREVYETFYAWMEPQPTWPGI